MKKSKCFNDLRAYAAFIVVVFFATFFVACGGSNQIIEEPPIVEKRVPVVKTTNLQQAVKTGSGMNVGVDVEIISDGGEAITASGVCWVADGTPTIANNRLTFEISSGIYSTTIQNLALMTNWYIRAYATNKIGTGYGEKLNFYYAYPKVVVVANPVSDITMTKATLSGAVIPYEQAKVYFEYHEKGNALWTSEDLSAKLALSDPKDSAKLSLSINLTPGTDYGFRIRAINSSGEVISPEQEFSSYAVADKDGNLYHSVKIGDQVWLQENLRTTKHADGYSIVNQRDSAAWKIATRPIYCWYNNDIALGKTYGALYNFYTAVSPRGLIKGWHVPTEIEWNNLQNYLQNNGVSAAPQLKEIGTVHWLTTSAAVTNSSGFTALPNGTFSPDKNNKFVFMNLGELATFWSATPLSGMSAISTSIDNTMVVSNINNRTKGFGIRLIKDK